MLSGFKKNTSNGVKINQKGASNTEDDCELKRNNYEMRKMNLKTKYV